MDKRGYDRVVAALEAVPDLHSPVVLPEPQEGENVRYVTVEFHVSVPPSLVLNALDKASLLHKAGSSDLGIGNRLALECVSAAPECVTLVDRAAR